MLGRKSPHVLSLLLGGSLMLALMQPAHAQPQSLPQSQLPAAAQPGREDLRLPDHVPATAPQRLEAPATAAPGRPVVSAPAIRITDVRIHGSSVYTSPQLRAYTRALHGKTATLNDIRAVADAITARYRADGYLLARAYVPVQTVTGGRVRIHVIEGRAARVSFQYGPGANRCRTVTMARRVRARILASRPLNTRRLERALLLYNDLPGVTAQTIVQPSDTPGAVDLTVLVRFKRLEGFAQLDNRGTAFAGPGQATVGVSINDPFCDGGALDTRLATSLDGQELRFGEVGYRLPLNNNGLQLATTVSHAATKPGDALEVFNIRGRATRLQASLRQPLIRSRAHNLSVSGGMAYSDIDTDLLGTALYRDRIASAHLRLDWDAVDAWSGTSFASAEVTRGLPLFGNDTNSRPSADANFTRINLLLGREQAILTTAFSVYLAAQGQWASSPLYASEEFALGGERLLSAFDPATLSGDSGAAIRLEVRRTKAHGPDAYNRPPFIQSSQYYTFTDVGAVHNRDPAAGQPASQSLASAGTGIRWQAQSGWSAAFEVAQALTGTTDNLGGHGAGPRAFVRVTKRF